MVKRQVAQPLMSYRDPDGRQRHALKNEMVEVHPDHVDAFDKLNDDPNRKVTPRKRAAPRKT